MDDEVFRALADASRRTLLDRLFERDGQTLGDLEAALPEMTRFGVMKHLEVLEAAGPRDEPQGGPGAAPLPQPVPIRRIHDRWLDRYRIRAADLLDDLESALEAPMTTRERRRRDGCPAALRAHDVHPRHAGAHLAGADGLDVHRPLLLQQHRPQRLGRRQPVRVPDTTATAAIEGVVLESDPPRRLAITFQALWTDAVRADAPSKIIFEIDDAGARRVEAHGDPRGARGSRRDPRRGRRRVAVDRGRASRPCSRPASR